MRRWYLRRCSERDLREPGVNALPFCVATENEGHLFVSVGVIWSEGAIAEAANNANAISPGHGLRAPVISNHVGKRQFHHCVAVVVDDDGVLLHVAERNAGVAVFINLSDGFKGISVRMGSAHCRDQARPGWCNDFFLWIQKKTAHAIRRTILAQLRWAAEAETLTPRDKAR